MSEQEPPPQGWTWARIYKWTSVAATFATLVASILAIVGVVVWIDEKGEREEERRARQEERDARVAEAEARRISLIGQAHAAIASASADGFFDTEESGLTKWAFETLVREREPIRIAAEHANIHGVDVTCTRLNIRAKSIGFSDVLIRRSELDLDVQGPMNVYFIRSGLLDSFVSASWNGEVSQDPDDVFAIVGSEAYLLSLTQYRRTSKDGEPETYKQDDALDLAIHGTRAKSLLLLTSNGTTSVPFIGPEAVFRPEDFQCQKTKDRHFECGEAGTDRRPTLGVGEEVWVDLRPPDCEVPPRFGEMRFRAPTSRIEPQ